MSVTIEIKAYANSDSSTVVWYPSDRINGCLGFALHRRPAGGGAEVVIENRIGFQGDPNAKPGQHQSSEIWPIQRMVWSDYTAAGTGTVEYKVVAKLGNPGKLSDGPASDWSGPVEVGTNKTDGFQAYFNRGIVPSQYVAAELAQQGGKPTALLAADIAKPNDPLRAQLSGVLRTALLQELAAAQSNGETIYAALYELNDPELIAALQAFKGKCNLLLGSGAFGTKKVNGKSVKVTDENAAVRKTLKASRTINVFDRLVSGKHYAHNKFVVFCDGSGPKRLWTGSTNWTVTGLCTQVNNGIFIESPELAQAYLARWKTLQAAGNDYPPNVAEQGSTPAHVTVGANKAPVTAWNVPCLKLVDLADAQRLIEGARQGVLFLFFNPGTHGTLLNDILALNQDNLYVHGVANQDPGGKKAPLLTLHDRGNAIDAEPEVTLPRNLNAPLSKWFQDEPKGPLVMIHSKVVVIDPFGQHPVVMTGSHNLGPKASQQNDDNLLIVENAPGLAQEYAVNIMGVFDHYKFRYANHVAAAQGKGGKPGRVPSHPTWGGLQTNDSWQDGYLKADRKRELDFWFGRFQPGAPGVETRRLLDKGPGTTESHTPASRHKRASTKLAVKKKAAAKTAGTKAVKKRRSIKR